MFNSSAMGEIGMPVGQQNAALSDELVMRVGVPHIGGALTSHAFEEEFPVMVSASAFWRQDKGCFKIPEHTNLHELDLALDSGGFVSGMLFKKKGKQRGIAGIYPWSLSAYVELANTMGVNWWSQPDFCVEEAIAETREEVDYRINATATMLEATLRLVYEWQNELAKMCSSTTVANMIKPCVPIVQGFTISDYQRSADMLMQVWSRWQPWLDAPTLIGVGSVCRRSVKHPVHGLNAILAGLEGLIPESSRVHCFGVKGTVLSELKMLPWVASADSMAWDFGARVKARKAGCSNTMAHRSREMSEWMQKAASRLKPTAGDQFRLPLFS